jgi:hypothetical protein
MFYVLYMQVLSIIRLEEIGVIIFGRVQEVVKQCSASMLANLLLG